MKMSDARALREANKALNNQPKGWSHIPSALARGLWDVLLEWIGERK